MSSIERLAIQGIRSFSPDEEQIIQFRKPITLICGPNGTGKSTIIECLKYATTGILPPGCGNKSGQAFIFDTELAGTSEVKATIKLLFRNRQRKYTLIQRHFKLVKKKTKKEFKALDGVLKMKDPKTGEEISQSNRCSDLDKLVPELLGVSPAILDNVVFCHQEENNWPLKESAELKKKFDDIFESTRYTKALAELRKAKKEVADKAKDAHRDVTVLANNLEQANQLRTEQDDTNLLLEENAEKISNLNSQLDVHKSKLAAVQEQLQKFDSVFEKIREMSGVISERQRVLERERVECAMTPEDENISVAQLQVLYETSNGAYQKTFKEIQEHAQTKQEYEREKASMAAEVEVLSTERANLNARMEEAERQRKRHDSLAMEARSRYPKFIKNERMTMGEMKEAMNLVVKEKRDELAKQEAVHRHGYDEASKALEEVRGQMTALEHQKSSLEQEHAKSEQLLSSLASKLSNLGEDSEDAETRLKEARVRAHEQMKRVDALRNDGAAEQKKRSIDETKKQIAVEDSRKQQLEAGIAKLESQQEVVVRLKAKRSEVATKAVSILTRLSTHDTSLQKLLDTAGDQSQVLQCFREAQEACTALKVYWGRVGGVSKDGPSPTKKSRIAIESEASSSVSVDAALPSRVRMREISEKVQKVWDAVKDVVRARKSEQETTRAEYDSIVEQTTLIVGQLQSTDSEMKQLMAQKTQLEESLPKAEYLEIVSQAEPRDGEKKEDAALRKLEDELESARAERSLQTNMKELYRMYVARIRETSKCVTCGQACDDIKYTTDHPIKFKLNSTTELSFEGHKEYRGADALQLSLISKTEANAVKDKERVHAERIKKCEERLATFRKHLNTARRLEDVEQALVEKQERYRTLEISKDEISRVGQKKNAMAQSMDMPLREAERIEREIAEAYRLCKDAERVEEDADREERHVGSTVVGGGAEMDGVVSLEQARNKLRQISLTKDKLTQQILDDTKELQAIQSTLEREMGNSAEAQSIVSKLEKEARERLELLRDRKRVSDQLAEFVGKAEEIRMKINPLEKQRDDFEENRRKTSDSAKKELDKLRQELDACMSDQKTLESAREATENALRNGVKEKLAEVDERLKARRSRMDELTEGIAKLDKARELLELNARKYDTFRKQYTQFIRYAQSKLELRRIEQEKQDLEREALAGQDGTKDLKAEMSKLQDLVQEISLKKQKLSGMREAYETRVNQISAQLLDPKLKDVDKRHADQLVVAVTTAMAAKDLDKYSKALDTALMRFHAEKVEEINKRIRELWQLIYRGGDIDRVQLKAEQGTGVSAHTYTYRVVMSKNNTELDMRGRCSAGQKVLASLVIRLALADTFSVNCGVLALDEPSTNLDLENKKGLAEALGDIIKSRHNQDNFQLIVITHDDEFVDIIQNQIGSSGGPFYRVFREQDQSGRYVSRIKEDSGTTLS